jgi:hypothetical protein
MVHEDQVLSKVLTRQAFENAIKTLAAHRRLDQRGHPPDRHRAPHRRGAGHRGLRPLASELPCLVEPAALGQVPDGRLLLRRRPAGGDEGNLEAPAPRCR